jgi:hypothetical protein
LVSHQAGSGNGVRYIPEYVEMPRWFRMYELGLAIPDGPSILWTLRHLDRINRKHRAALAAQDLPKAKQESKLEREQAEAERRCREWRALLRFRRSALDARSG